MSHGNSSVFHECGPGWRNLIDPIVHKIDVAGGIVDQVKEKYARLRIYWTPMNCVDKDITAIDDMIDSAEIASGSICELCGKVGRTMTSGSWLKTVCDDHAKELGYRRIT